MAKTTDLVSSSTLAMRS